MGRFRFSSVVAILLLLTLWPVVAPPTHASRKEAENPKQVKEDALAGLRPGRDTIEKAYRRFGKDRVDQGQSTDSSISWRDVCNHQGLTVAIDSNGVIQEVIVGPEVGVTTADCDAKSYSREVRAKFGSGHGLLLRDHCDRIQKVYGTAQSKSSSDSRNERFESYLYRFDWEGKRAPLTLEVACNSEDQVYRIKLVAATGLAR
jgi:hypothetical protein